MGDFDADGVTQISARAFLGGDRILVADAHGRERMRTAVMVLDGRTTTVEIRPL